MPQLQELQCEDSRAPVWLSLRSEKFEGAHKCARTLLDLCALAAHEQQGILHFMLQVAFGYSQAHVFLMACAEMAEITICCAAGPMLQLLLHHSLR